MACLRKDTCEIVLFLSRDDGGCGHPGNGIELPCPLQVGNPERAGVPLWSATAEIPAPVHALWEEFGRLNPTHVLASDFDNNGRTDAVMITAPPLDQTLSCIDDDDPENPVENWVDPHGVISFTGVGDPDMAIDMFKSMMGFDFYFGIADVAVGNFNDDPYPDIAVASLRKNPCTGCTGSWMRNVDVLVGGYAISPITLDNGKTMVCGAAPGDEVVPGGFLATGGRAYDSSPSAIAAARLDGDEIDDIIVAIRGNGVSGNNCSVPDELLVLPTRHEPQAGPCEAPPPPFNVCEAWTYSDCSAEYTVCESQTSVKYPATGEFPVAIATGDVNNDGIVDILAANQKTHDVTLLTGTIDPWGEYVVDTLEHPAKLISLGEEPRDIALGDVDGDGFLDLVGAFEKKVSISWGVDGTNFETPFYIEALPCGAGIFPSKAIAADFSGDGFDDVLVLSKKTSRIYLYVSLGQRSFAGPYQFTAASKPTDIQMCDINQDGCTDLMVANEDSHTVSLLVNEFCP
jgi:hypothetical protein